MERQFWLERWARNETAFHLPEVNPKLTAFWPLLGLTAGSRVLVPLAGKTVDLRWLREQGHSVLAVELSEDAALAFFAEAGLTPTRTEVGAFTHLAANHIEYFVGDIFDLGTETLGAIAGIWDRGALVALPAKLRQRYVAHLGALGVPGTRTLLVALEYAQDRMQGPPFSVEVTEIEALFGATHDISRLDREDILDQEPRFRARGLEALESCVYQLVRQG